MRPVFARSTPSPRLTPLFKSLACALTACALAASAFTACALQGDAAHARSLSASQVRLEVLDGDGYPLPSFERRGQTYVMGEYGQRYKLRVINRTGGRVEAVVTVDGRDVVNGALGSYSNRGYVLDAYESVTVEGFRRSGDEVATFRFTSPGDSYAGRMGSAGNVGVIGMAVFEERPRPTPRKARVAEEGYAARGEGRSLDSAPAAPSPRAEAELSAAPSGGAGRAGEMKRSKGYSGPQSDLRSEIGTQYGESRVSQVEEVVFRRRSDTPALVYALQYDTEEGLRRRGVIPPPPPQGPSAFPNEGRYAPPPP